MARSIVLTSDFTGQPVTTPAVVRVTVGDAIYVADADANDDIVRSVQENGRPTGKRGRKKK